MRKNSYLCEKLKEASGMIVSVLAFKLYCNFVCLWLFLCDRTTIKAKSIIVLCC